MNQLATSSPILLQDLKPEFTLPPREYPDTSNEFMRFQIGSTVRVTDYEPLYDGRRLVGLRPLERKVSAFKLIGFGSTLRAAQKMAKGK